MSEEVDHLDAFVSHNWSTSRASKFLTLAFHFNLKAAVAVSTLVALVPFVFGIFGKLQIIGIICEGREELDAIGCQIVGMVTFLLALFFWHEMSALVGFKGPRVFLDKTCVHQTDADLKRQGIQNIAAYLQYSWSMVALYSNIYLEKLWTVYEIATFFMLFPRGRLYVRPVFLPKLMLPSMLFVVGVRVTCHLLRTNTLKILPMVQAFYLDYDDNDDILSQHKEELFRELGIQFLVMFPFTLALAAICRWWAVEQACIRQRLQGFDIHRAQCQSEDDRKVVEENVAIFATHLGFVPTGTRKVDTLNMFNDLVHEEVPRVLRASLGPTGIPYRFVVAFFIVYHFYSLDILSAAIRMHGLQPRVLMNFSLAILMYTCIGPLGIAAFSVTPKYTMKFESSIAHLIFLSVTNLLALGFGLCVHFFLGYLLHKSRKDPLPWSVMYLSCSLLLAVLTYIVYRPPATEKEDRRLDRGSSFKTSSGFGYSRALSSMSIPEGGVLDSFGDQHLEKPVQGGEVGSESDYEGYASSSSDSISSSSSSSSAHSKHHSPSSTSWHTMVWFPQGLRTCSAW